MVHIDSEKLQSELNSVQSEFDTWADGLEAGLQNLSREYKDKIQEGTGSLKDLKILNTYVFCTLFELSPKRNVL